MSSGVCPSVSVYVCAFVCDQIKKCPTLPCVFVQTVLRDKHLEQIKCFKQTQRC